MLPEVLPPSPPNRRYLQVCLFRRPRHPLRRIEPLRHRLGSPGPRRCLPRESPPRTPVRLRGRALSRSLSCPDRNQHLARLLRTRRPAAKTLGTARLPAEGPPPPVRRPSRRREQPDRTRLRRERLPRPNRHLRTSRAPPRGGTPCHRGAVLRVVRRCRRSGVPQRVVPRRRRLRGAPRRRLARRHWAIRSPGRSPRRGRLRRRQRGKGPRLRVRARRLRPRRVRPRPLRPRRLRPRPHPRLRLPPFPLRPRPLRPRPLRPRPLRPRPLRPRPLRPRPLRLRLRRRSARSRPRRLPQVQRLHRRRPDPIRRAGQDRPGTGPVRNRAGPFRVAGGQPVRPRRVVSRASA
jgi:hypothetical protein